MPLACRCTRQTTRSQTRTPSWHARMNGAFLYLHFAPTTTTRFPILRVSLLHFNLACCRQGDSGRSPSPLLPPNGRAAKRFSGLAQEAKICNRNRGGRGGDGRNPSRPSRVRRLANPPAPNFLHRSRRRTHTGAEIALVATTQQKPRPTS